MRTVKLNIKAQDIINTEYIHSEDCAITKALQRAGIDARDCGTNIKDAKSNHWLTGSHDPKYQELVKRVVGMYSYIDEYQVEMDSKYIVAPHDFSVELDLDL